MFKKSKFIKLIALSVISTSLFSCGSNGNKEPLTKNVVISEVYVGNSLIDSCLEIANTGTSSINLTGYQLVLYKDKNNIDYTYTFKETLEASKTMIFANNTFDAASKNIVDYINIGGDFIYGRNYIELLDSNGTLIDCVGYKGIQVTYVEKQSLIRLKEFSEGFGTFDSLHFIKVKLGVSKYLGNIEAPLSVEEIRKGPSIDEEYSNYEFCSSDDKPLGGCVNVNLKALGDGDTTQFTYPSEYSRFDDYSHRIRYLLINTPEVDHGSSSSIVAEPWGKAAQELNNTLLSGAKKIIIQSNRNFSLTETYGRVLGYVWYSNEANTTLKDYKLLNFIMVQEGLARFSTYDKYETMYSGDVLYFDYINYVYEEAYQKGIKIWGETDPDF